MESAQRHIKLILFILYYIDIDIYTIEKEQET